MHFLHLDSLAALTAVPPFGIREPRPTYDDGGQREDVLLVGAAAARAGCEASWLAASGRQAGWGVHLTCCAGQQSGHYGWPLLACCLLTVLPPATDSAGRGSP
jgi:hypothetical protein